MIHTRSKVIERELYLCHALDLRWYLGHWSCFSRRFKYVCNLGTKPCIPAGHVHTYEERKTDGLNPGCFARKHLRRGKQMECALLASAAFCRENVNSLSFPAPATGVDRLRGLCSIPHTSIWLALPQGPGIWRKKSAGCDPLSDSVLKSGGGAFAEARSGKL